MWPIPCPMGRFSLALRLFFPGRGPVLAIPILIGVPGDVLKGLVQILALTGWADWLCVQGRANAGEGWGICLRGRGGASRR